MAGKQFHQRRFAGAVLADDRVKLPGARSRLILLKTSIDPEERDKPAASRTVAVM
jgi:hypothetical protein